jgi:hypothetical protein
MHRIGTRGGANESATIRQRARVEFREFRGGDTTFGPDAHQVGVADARVREYVAYVSARVPWLRRVSSAPPRRSGPSRPASGGNSRRVMRCRDRCTGHLTACRTPCPCPPASARPAGLHVRSGLAVRARGPARSGRRRGAHEPHPRPAWPPSLADDIRQPSTADAGRPCPARLHDRAPWQRREPRAVDGRRINAVVCRSSGPAGCRGQLGRRGGE